MAAKSRAQIPQSAIDTRPIKVLFIGNSYTYYNDMPAMVAAFAAANAGRPIDQRTYAVGGASLESLWSLRKTKEMIHSERWDFVVLQEQSMRPIEASDRMFKFARRYDTEIDKVGARTILYATWARRGQPKSQPWIDAAYAKLAAMTDATTAPVGQAWRIALETNPKLPLYDADDSHPTPTGSYLAACTFYLVITGSEQPCPSVIIAGVTSEHAAIARNAAAQTVLAARQNSIR